ncbi:MAG: ATP-binding protein [Candidatus Latescibacterota bacterium]|nr:MAG: ATP-binding protein [Candidatus Latescibacterota bacterium]
MARMVKRRFWIAMIERAWLERSVVWLAGVRRAGKTFLARSFPDIEYFDCELPRVRRSLEDAEGFLENMNGRRIALDEIHRLGNASELLKIAADHYPDVRVLATGSSTLGASKRFKDTLAGRKRDIWLTPLCSFDLDDFGSRDFEHRLSRGGLPPFFMAKGFPERDYQEWFDSFWAKDIQELFRLEKRASFQRFAELCMMQSGGIFEATSFAAPCEASRQTIANYLKVLEATFVVHVIRPFSGRRSNEIVSAPKIYAFDTGFISYFRGWKELRPSDLGSLWEHFVLNEMIARMQSRRINYWRDKRGHEVDFVLAGRGRDPVAIECKWSAAEFSGANLAAFRRQYPKGSNYVIARDVTRSFVRRVGDSKIRFIGLTSLGAAAREAGMETAGSD